MIFAQWAGVKRKKRIVLRSAGATSLSGGQLPNAALIPQITPRRISVKPASLR